MATLIDVEDCTVMKRMATVAMLAMVLMGQGVATKPTVKPADSLAAHLNTMPKNLWPEVSESQLKSQTRDAWVKDNVVGQKLGPWKVVGTIVEVKMIGGKVAIDLAPQKATILGASRELRYTISLPDVSVDAALTWKKGMEVTVSGHASLGPPLEFKVAAVPLNVLIEEGSVVTPPKNIIPDSPTPPERGGRGGRRG